MYQSQAHPVVLGWPSSVHSIFHPPSCSEVSSPSLRTFADLIDVAKLPSIEAVISTNNSMHIIYKH